MSIYADAKRQRAGQPESHQSGEVILPASNWSPPIPFGRDTPPPLFPVEIFPDWLSSFVTALSIATQTPLCAGAMRWVTSRILHSTCGGHHAVRPGVVASALPRGDQW